MFAYSEENPKVENRLKYDSLFTCKNGIQDSDIYCFPLLLYTMMPVAVIFCEREKDTVFD